MTVRNECGYAGRASGRAFCVEDTVILGQVRLGMQIDELSCWMQDGGIIERKVFTCASKE